MDKIHTDKYRQLVEDANSIILRMDAKGRKARAWGLSIAKEIV